MMDDNQFEHMLTLSVIYLPVLQMREILDQVGDMSSADIHNHYNGFDIIAKTFLEMQRRLNAKPKFRRKVCK